jgi:phosphoadenylyl-sulfate reductase (thioredoxin)
MTAAVSEHELSRLATAFEGAPPEETITAIALRFSEKIALACSFGAEDCVLVDVVARNRLPVRIFTLDTGFLFPETQVLWQRLEERYGVRIVAAPAELPPNDFTRSAPWERDPDECCHVRKVLPLRAMLASHDAWITGIRRDQTPERAGARVIEWDARFGLIKLNPLAAWTAADVAAHVRQHDVPTNPLHERGYLSIGCAPCTSPVKPGEGPRAGRWRGREKTECGLHVDRTPGSGGAGRP